MRLLVKRCLCKIILGEESFGTALSIAEHFRIVCCSGRASQVNLEEVLMAENSSDQGRSP